MFKRKKKRNKEIDETLSATAYITLRETLENILKTEVKKPNGDGKETTDFPLTLSAIRMKARTALDFVDNLTKITEEK